MNKVITFISVLLVPLFLLVFLYQNPNRTSSIARVNPIKLHTKVSATIAILGDSKYITIFGYTSPNASVTVTATGISDITTADKTGFFRFIQTLVYKSTKEICIHAKDSEGRLTQPTCIPFHFSHTIDGIGPVVLAPTLTVAKGEFLPDEPITYSGQSIPNKNVRLFITSELLKNPLFVSASELNTSPTKKIIEIMTNDTGRFSLFTKSGKPQTQRIYSGVSYNGSNSPKSTRLTVKILPWWILLLSLLKSFILKYGLELALCFEGLFLLYYIFKKHHNIHAIILRKKQQLQKAAMEIIPYESDKAMQLSN